MTTANQSPPSTAAPPLPPEPEKTGVQGSQGPTDPAFQLIPAPGVSYSSMSETLVQFADRGITKSAIVFVHAVVRQLENRILLLETTLEEVRAELKIANMDGQKKAVTIARYEETTKHGVPTKLTHAFIISVGALLLGAYFSAISLPLPEGETVPTAWTVAGLAGAVLFLGGWFFVFYTRPPKN